MTILKGTFDIPLGDRWPVIRIGPRPPIPVGLRQLVHHRDGGRCVFCGIGQGWLELDHIVPWSAGGADESANLRLLCSGCNQDRSNFRTERDVPALPVTRGCDSCIRVWVRRYGYCHFGRIVSGAAQLAAFFGTCGRESTVTDPARLL